MNRQDGPLLVGANNENTNTAKPLLVNDAGELLVTTAGGPGVSDVNLDEVGGVAIDLGQEAMAGSIPVVIASDQSPIPVTGSISATNPSVDATGGAVPAEATYIGINAGGNLAGAVAGSGTAAAALRVELPTNGTGVIATVGAVTAITNALPVGNNNIGDVDIASGTITAVTTITNPVTVIGSVADDSPTPGNPVTVAGLAKSPDGTDPSSLAENDVARFITDLNRRVYVNANHPRSLVVHLDGSGAYTDQALIADPGDGFQVVITNIIGSTGAATALNFFLEEGATKIFGPIYLEAVNGRGFCSGPMYLPCTPSTAVTLTSSAAIAQSYNVTYFVQAV